MHTFKRGDVFMVAIPGEEERVWGDGDDQSVIKEGTFKETKKVKLFSVKGYRPGIILNDSDKISRPKVQVAPITRLFRETGEKKTEAYSDFILPFERYEEFLVAPSKVLTDDAQSVSLDRLNRKIFSLDRRDMILMDLCLIESHGLEGTVQELTAQLAYRILQKKEWEKAE